jgi:hypothetical protein
MSIDKEKIETFDDDDTAEMDRANERVEAEMRVLESRAKRQVADGLQDKKLAEDAERLRHTAEKELRDIDEAREDET